MSYANSAKEEILGVHPDTLERSGAVSEDAAREMAAGARRCFASDVAAAVTGIAGPDGGTPEKPVGTVWFAISDAAGHDQAKRRSFAGDREVVRRAAALHALELLRRHLNRQAYD